MLDSFYVLDKLLRKERSLLKRPPTFTAKLVELQVFEESVCSGTGLVSYSTLEVRLKLLAYLINRLRRYSL